MSHVTKTPSSNTAESLTDAGLHYIGSLMTPAEADAWQVWLLNNITWSDDGYEAFGRRFPIPRRQAWFADEGICYRYSDNLLPTQPWPEPLQHLRQQVETQTRQRFNSVLATLYRSGSDSVGWHADDEPELGPAPVIASLSVGATRIFRLRPKVAPEQQRAVPMHSGDLWLMQPQCQQHWEHAVIAEPGVQQPRINLTFRWVTPPSA
ncbi:alpha-ketoglutarate-dependent dioxygenase AlkB [Oceanobacter sp. 3_MG-2023]|uniref:alpha-ketoglutarate-dependent dioxygenase AlkB family protein n=1 Tax=Oceanobacter sp. 3_MG-2023 TaxID=3062622 RepID=UPI0027370C56|nr:alpha-ketoglutarate-dependent dioxygenase AlkB [Oceanobacter sp. 3_MG-2023]MDP2504197.1 alpha-ketoglutarate-dependent dioxygenase AlkB [Oceanobacter sp. 3_MG-2023]